LNDVVREHRMQFQASEALSLTTITSLTIWHSSPCEKKKTMYLLYLLKVLPGIKYLYSRGQAKPTNNFGHNRCIIGNVFLSDLRRVVKMGQFMNYSWEEKLQRLFDVQDSGKIHYQGPHPRYPISGLCLSVCLHQPMTCLPLLRCSDTSRQ
jgi:hypothetical protein